MPITVRPLSTADVPEFFDVNRAAFHATSLFGQAVWPNGWTAARRAARIAEWSVEINEKPNFFLLAAYDADIGDEIIGGARWERQSGAKSAETIETRKEDEVPEDPDFPVNKDIMQAFEELNEGNYKRNMGGKACWHLQLLFSNIAHGRRGAGSALLQWGIDRADLEGLPCYLDATPMGKSLYEKMGFEVKEVKELNLSRFGKEGVIVTYSMVRPVKGAVGCAAVEVMKRKTPEVEMTVAPD